MARRPAGDLGLRPAHDLEPSPIVPQGVARSHRTHPLVAQGGRYRWQLPDGVSLHVDVEDAEQALAAAREALAAGDTTPAYQGASYAATRLPGPVPGGPSRGLGGRAA